jgi:predicted ribonuclease YlaK
MAVWGVTARNSGQKAAIQALMNDKPFVFLTGPAGTGKTLVAEATGLQRMEEARDFRKMVYTRLQTQLGKDIGAIPGGFDEKTYPFIRPFVDNLEVITQKPMEVIRSLAEGEAQRRRLFFDPIQTLRGGTFSQAYVIVDEAQNLDVPTILAVATRIGHGSKMVFCGNFAQTDETKLRTPKANGLYRLLSGLYEHDADKAYFDHVNLTQVERNPAVDLIERILRSYDMPAEFDALEAMGNV